jgi:hypothetical protein
MLTFVFVKCSTEIPNDKWNGITRGELVRMGNVAYYVHATSWRGECRRDEKVTTRMCSTTLSQLLSPSHRPATHSPRVGCTRMCKLVTTLWCYSGALFNAFLWIQVTVITAQGKCGSVVRRSGLMFSAESVVWRSSRLTCPALTTLFWLARILQNFHPGIRKEGLQKATKTSIRRTDNYRYSNQLPS